MTSERVRIAIAAASEDIDDQRFCAEVYLGENYVGRVCEIEGSTDYTIELVSNADKATLAAVIAEAKTKLRKHKAG